MIPEYGRKDTQLRDYKLDTEKRVAFVRDSPKAMQQVLSTATAAARTVHWSEYSASSPATTR